MQDHDDGKDRRIIQLRKGILELAVMGVLYGGRHYGYSLVRVLSEHGGTSLKEGTVYPILARLDRDGLVRSEWVESDQGPPRKYYALTPAGRRLFTELSQELDVLVSLVRQEWAESEDIGKKLLVEGGRANVRLPGSSGENRRRLCGLSAIPAPDRPRHGA